MGNTFSIKKFKSFNKLFEQSSTNLWSKFSFSMNEFKHLSLCEF
jgi:hypothetical protein